MLELCNTVESFVTLDPDNLIFDKLDENNDVVSGDRKQYLRT